MAEGKERFGERSGFRECLDHIIILSERCLRYHPQAFCEY
jgi:hypothetical protein